MAVTTDSLVLHWGVDLDGGPWGSCVLTDCVVVRPVRVFDAWPLVDFAAGVRLASGAVVGTCRTPIREVAALESWGPAQIELRPDAPKTGVTVRLWDGTSEWYWNGSAWVAPTLGTHWTTLANLYLHLDSFTGRSLGFTIRLSRTALTDESPVLAGVKGIARIMFAATSADTRRAASWEDDLLHRILVRRAMAELVVSGSDEYAITTSNRTEIDLSNGVGEYPYDVVGVEAVFDVTSDPTLRAPLAGTWNGTTKKWTPTAVMTVGHIVLIRFTFRPWVEHMSDVDFFTDRLPAVVFSGLSILRDRRGFGSVEVYNEADIHGISVDAPAVQDLSISGRILAARTSDRDRIWKALDLWLGDCADEVSPSTSLPVSLELVPGDVVPVLGSHAERQFSVRVSGWAVWPGTEREVHTVTTGGWSPQVTEEA